MSDDSTWANDIVIDQSILDIAAGTKASAGARKLTKFEVVQALSDAFNIGAQRGDAAQDWATDLITKWTPLPEPKSTNERYNLLAKIVEQLPEDMWYGITAYVNGKEQLQVPAFQSFNILPYLNKLQNDPNAPSVNKDALKKTIEQVTLRVDAFVETSAAAQGMTPADEQVTAAKEAAHSQTAIPSPTGGAAATPVITASGMTIDPSMLEAGNAQEVAQTYPETTLADLGFDKKLRFGLKGLFAGGDTGGEDGIDVYEAARWIYSLTPEQIGKLQVSLAKAGYFDLVGQSYERVNDKNDVATRMAWDLFLVDVVRAGSEANPQDVLNRQMAGYLSSRAPKEGYVFNDEATLRSLGNELAQQLVGRQLDSTELNDFYKMARAWERSAALGATFAEDNYQVDVRARAEQYFDRELRLENSKQLAYEWAMKHQ